MRKLFRTIHDLDILLWLVAVRWNKKIKFIICLFKGHKEGVFKKQTDHRYSLDL